MINAQDISRTVAKKLKLNDKICSEAVNCVLETIREEVVRGGEVHLRNLFRISAKRRSGRTIKDPFTKKTHPAKPYVAPVCYFSKNVRQEVKNSNPITD